MHLRWLEYFIVVAEEQSVSRAAQRLRMSQAALSRIIRDLEQRLELDLFQRTGRGMKVTDEGAVLLTEARQVAAQYQSFQDKVDVLRGDRTGSVRILLPLRLGAQLTKPLLDAFAARHASATADVFEALNEDIQTQLRADKADIAIHYSPLVYADTPGEVLGSEALYVAGTPHVLGGDTGPIRMEHTSRLPLLMQSSPAAFRDFVGKSFETAGYALTVHQHLNTVESHLDYARAGDGATIMPFSVVRRDVERGTLVARKIVEPEITRTIHLVTATQATTRLQRETIALLKEIVVEHHDALRWTLA